MPKSESGRASVPQATHESPSPNPSRHRRSQRRSSFHERYTSVHCQLYCAPLSSPHSTASSPLPPLPSILPPKPSNQARRRRRSHVGMPRRRGIGYRRRPTRRCTPPIRISHHRSARTAARDGGDDGARPVWRGGGRSCLLLVTRVVAPSCAHSTATHLLLRC